LDDDEGCGLGTHNLEELDEEDEMKESEDIKPQNRHIPSKADLIRTKLALESIKQPVNSSFTTLAASSNRNMNKRLYSQT
jgi:hypothetical protein